MKKTHYYCDLCCKEMGRPTSEEGTLVKRRAVKFIGSPALEVAIVVRAWSGNQIDICEECAKSAVLRAQEEEECGKN